jgi:uncharacterized protein (TIGR03437 family)
MDTVVAPGLPLPTQLGDVTILVDGVAAPILAVVTRTTSSVPTTQVNFQVPFEVAKGTGPQPHTVEVQYAGESAFVTPQQAAPGVFTLPDATGVVQHGADYSLVTAQNPADPGETVIVYATGLGPPATPVPSGMGATGADPVGPACDAVSANLGKVLYAGLTPGLPGLYQVNIRLSQDLPAGPNSLNLQSASCWLGGAPPAEIQQSNTAKVYVAQQ